MGEIIELRIVVMVMWPVFAYHGEDASFLEVSSSSVDGDEWVLKDE